MAKLGEVTLRTEAREVSVLAAGTAATMKDSRQVSMGLAAASGFVDSRVVVMVVVSGLAILFVAAVVSGCAFVDTTLSGAV